MDPDAPTTQLPPDLPPPQPEPEPKRLTRSSGDRVLTGVAGGLGRHLGVDPVLIRVGFVVLAVLGGAGLLLYLVLALVIPSDKPGGASTESRLATTGLVVLALLALVTVPFLGGGLLFFAPGLLALVVVVVICLLVVRAVQGGDVSVARVLLALVAVAAAAVLGFAAAAGVAFGGGTPVAIVVLALGVALVVAGFVGGARWLVLPALAVAIPAVLVASSGLDLRGGVGNREVRPAGLTDVRPDYRLGVGRLAVDLRGVDFSGVTDVKVSAGMGRIEVVVPRRVCVQTRATTSAGDLDVFGNHTSGLDATADDAPTAREGRPTLRLDGDVTMGQLVVSHTPQTQARPLAELNASPDAQKRACVIR